MANYGIWKDNILYNARSPGQVMRQYDEKVTTVHELMDQAFKTFKDRPAVGFRRMLGQVMETDDKGKEWPKLTFANEYTWQTYGQWEQRVSSFGKGLLEWTGAQPKDRMLVYAETQVDWMTAAAAGWRHNLQVVTCYANLGGEGAAHAVSTTQSHVVVADAKLLAQLIKCREVVKASGKPCMKYIVSIENDVDPKLRQQLEADGVHVSTMDELVAKGAASQAPDAHPPLPEDIAVIMFTSGTTGLPKGVLISHRSLIAAVSGLHPAFRAVTPPINTNDVYIAYLPLAHIMEIVAEITNFSIGVSLGYGSPFTLTDTGVKLAQGQSGDLVILKPTVVVFAPLVLEKIYTGINAKFGALKGLKAKLRDWGLASGQKNFDSGSVGASWLYNATIFGKVQKITGSRIRLCITGSAPLDGNVHKFIQTCLNCPVRQGYGSTETCAASFLQLPTQNVVANVGPPTEACCMRLLDWEEGGYKSTDKDENGNPTPRGEILIGGAVITDGYLVDPENPDPELVKKNAEEFSEEGGIRWFHTGDIGKVHPDGTLSIIDRKKDLVKLQNGEYVALSKVEGAVKLASLVDNAMCHVNPHSSFSTVLVCPNIPNLKHWAKGAGVPADDLDVVCANPSLNAAIMAEIKEAAGTAKLQRFEIPGKCFVVPISKTWSPENELLTASQKIQRKKIIDAHKADIDAMYK